MYGKISIAVMSDLHFIDHDDAHGISYVDLSVPSTERHDPVGDLLRLIQSEDLTAKYVITPGDLTVAAGFEGLRAAWSTMHQFKDALTAEDLFAVTGNHDIASRSAGNEPEIWERLKKLTPPYPSPGLSELEQLRYWADHYAVVRRDPVRFFMLNTCNSHARGEKEYGRGRVTDYTIDKIRSAGGYDKDVKLNVLLCHHHPIRYADLTDTFQDYSEMVHGTRLLDSLAETDQPWLVIHGHKHFPKVTYAGGDSASIPVFSAGSFSAILSPVYFSTAVNQFYIIDIDVDDVTNLGMVGTVRAWDWIKGIGWVKSEYRDSHPGRLVNGSGFGYKTSLRQLATDIDTKLGSENMTRWDDVIASFPNMKYLLLEDRTKLISTLASKGIAAVNSNPLDPVQLIRTS